MALTIEELNVKITADIKGLKSEMSKVQSNVKEASQKVNRNSKLIAGGFNTIKLGAIAAAAGIGVMANSLLTSTDRIQKLSIRLGVTTEELSRLKFAAEQNGVSFDTMAMALQRMQRRVAEAAKGTGEAKDALKELGINAQELNKLSLDKQFEVVTQAMEGVGSTADRTRLAMKLFDSEGVALTQIMDQGAEALKRLKKETPNVITQEDADRIARFNDQMNILKQTLQGQLIPVLANVASEIIIFGQAVNKVMQRIMKFLAPVINMYKVAYGSAIESVTDKYKGLTQEFRKNTQAAKENNEAINQNDKQLESIGQTGTTVFKKIKDTARESNEAWADDLSERIVQSKDAFKSLSDFGTMVLNKIASGLTSERIVGPALQAITSALPGRASGGPVTKGQPTLVGEQGPEIMIPEGNGRIIPTSQVRESSGQQQQVTVNQTFNISTGAEVNLIDEKIRNAAPVIAASAASSVATSIRKGGSMSRLVGARA